MKKVVKLVVGGVLVVLLLAAAGVFLVFRSIDAIAERGIEKGGTYALGAETTVESADVAVFDGTFRMTGLNVANPEGAYTSPHFMKLPSAGVAVSLGSLLEDTVELPELSIGAIDMYLEGAGGDANYKRILENIKKLESSSDKSPGSEESAKKFIINRLTIDGATVHLSGIPGLSAALGDAKVSVPKIELQDVGSKEPMTASELISLIVKTVLATSIEVGGGTIPSDLLGDLQGQLAGLASLDELGIKSLEDVKGAVEEQLGKQAEDLQKKAEDAAKDIGDDIRKGIGDALNR